MKVERGFILTDEFSNGYFHWLADCLPRLAVLSDSGLLEGRTLIVPDYAGRFNYVRPTLAAFDLTATVFPGPRRSVFCNDLMVLSPVAPTGNYRPTVMSGLRDRFRTHFGSSGQGARIYASRALAGLRKIENESDVQAVFERHGFERIFLEKLSFDEQVKRVGSASILASNHGAGLTNMTWMQAGTVVMELRRSGDAQNNCFFSLASALGIGYRYMTCRPVLERVSAHRADLHVDVKELDRHLAAIVEASR
jgi:capsular polysaccharide biosynthesis protein